jgi:kinetochore protein Spc25, fungi type
MQEAIDGLTAQRDEHLQRRDLLKEEISDLQVKVKQRRDAQATHQRALESQARHNVPELRFWERCLGLRIEGSASGNQDQLKFVFVGLDDRDEGKEAWFELYMGARDYAVTTAKPRPDGEGLSAVVDRLNEEKDLGSFLKAMRELLADGMRH